MCTLSLTRLIFRDETSASLYCAVILLYIAYFFPLGLDHSKCLVYEYTAHTSIAPDNAVLNTLD